MTSDDFAAKSSVPATPWRHLGRHFAEMVAAMVAGMAVLGVTVRLLLALLGHSQVMDQTEARVAIMAINMAIGMTVWMRYRRHSWASILEMDAAMIIAFVLVLIPFWSGVLPEKAVMAVGHVLMLPAMALVMLRRRHEYASTQSAEG
ncbi:MAG TPA: hypothetical protein VFX61_18500 [Micromonosporaceae bacterium]|nr:hypothetical protein [Micromonosporaceae bacterium]